MLHSGICASCSHVAGSVQVLLPILSTCLRIYFLSCALAGSNETHLKSTLRPGPDGMLPEGWAVLAPRLFSGARRPRCSSTSMALGSKMSSLQEVTSSRQLPCTVPETDSAWPHRDTLQDTCTEHECAFHRKKMADILKLSALGPARAAMYSNGGPSFV